MPETVRCQIGIPDVFIEAGESSVLDMVENAQVEYLERHRLIRVSEWRLLASAPLVMTERGTNCVLIPAGEITLFLYECQAV